MKRKNTLKFLVLISALVISGVLHATDYYVPNEGDDSNSGISPEKSFKTIARINQLELKPGDKILFKSGDYYEGTLHVSYSGSPKKHIEITSFGEGERPIISGALIINNFELSNDNLYKAKCSQHVSSVYKNKKMLTHARYPNKGFLEMDGGGHDFLIDHDFPLSEKEIMGANVRMRINNWQYEYRKVTQFQNNEIHFDSILWNRSDWQNTCNIGWGYYLDGKQAFLDVANEWVYSETDKELFIMLDNALETSDVIEVSYIENGLVLQNGVSYISIDGLKLSGQTKHAVKALGNNKNIEVKNCEFTMIGQYALNFNKGCSHINITNNLIHNVFGSGVKLFETNNSKVEHNTIKNIGLVPGIGIDGVNGATGITVENEEEHHANPLELAHNNSISFNYIDSIGYGCIRLDGHNSICEKNIVKNGMLTLNDGGLIYCWGYDTTYTYNNIFRGNIVAYSHGNTEGTPSDHKINHGIYFDIRSKDLVVEDNVITYCNTAILNNAQCFRNTFRNNVCYNNDKSISFSEWGTRRYIAYVHDNVVQNNYFVNVQNMKHTLNIANHIGADIDPGTFSNNTYISPNEKFHIKKMVVTANEKLTREVTLEGWQKLSGQDKNSQLWVPEKDGQEYPFSEIFINEEDTSKAFKLNPEFEYINLEGKQLSNEIIIEARDAMVVFYRVR